MSTVDWFVIDFWSEEIITPNPHQYFKSVSREVKLSKTYYVKGEW